MQQNSLKVWNYTVNPNHRNGSAAKSQWSISVGQEKRVFTKAMAEGWAEVGSAKAWGLHLVNAKPQYLGHLPANSSPPKAPSFIAFFDLSAHTHGYPADYRQSHQKPPSAVRSNWVEREIISKAKASKIGQGKRCVL